MTKNDSWWVKISVSLLDHFVWNGEPFTRGQAWVDLILLVNHEPTKTVVDGRVIEVGIGEYVTSIRRLADRWNRSTKWVMDYLELLRSDNMIKTKVVGHGKNSKTLLFLVNYEGFQLSGNTKETNRKRKENAKKTQDGGKGVLDSNIYNTSIESGDLEKEENIPPSILTDTPPKGDAFEEDFSEFWNLYPRKDGRKDALKSYARARKNGATKEVILSGVKAFVEQCKVQKTERRFIPLPTTWLNQERWDFDYTSSEPYAKTVTGTVKRSVGLAENEIDISKLLKGV